MNFKFKVGMVALCSALMITLSTGCKKDEGTDDNNNGTPSGNTLCDGNGSASYLPLVQQNSWEWKQQGSGNNIHTWKVGGTETLGGKTYVKLNIVWDSGLTETTWYLRTGSDNTVYIYSALYGSGKEYTYMPASPALNQQWEYPVNGSYEGEAFRKVTSVNKSLTIGSCSYTGLVEVKEYRDASNVGTTYYYKKGLGLVRFNSLVNSDLRAVTLK